ELPVRALLSELVLLAGKAMASHLQALGMPGLYRMQAAPKPNEVEDILKLGNNLELDLTLEAGEDEDVRPQDYQNWVQKFGQSSAPRLLCYLLKGTLKPVKYGTHPGFHFGLADTEGYVPCVSPAGRYADLLMQRILTAVLSDGRDRRHSRTKEGVKLGSSTCHGKINWNVLPAAVVSDFDERVHMVLTGLNDRDKLAQDAETDLDGLKKAEQMKERTGQVFQGLITGVQSYGFFVEVEDLLLEGLVHVSSLKDDWYEYRARHSCLVGRKSRIAYRLGSRVRVRVKSVDYYRQQIDLVTVLEESDAAAADRLPEDEEE
ncbi:MAG: RNB domain-containing ribonuclease, partial [Cyanobacteria bacterium J06641_5]